MLDTALKILVNLARESADPKPVDTKDPTAKVFTTATGVISVPVPAPPRNHSVASLSDLIAYVCDHAGRNPESRVVVWYNDKEVVAVLDDHGHRVHRATLKFEPTRVFTRVLDLSEHRPWFDHKEFVRLLKHELVGTLAPSVLLEVVKKVKFENGSFVESSRDRARESIARSITASVSAEKDLPEEVVLAVRPWANPDLSDQEYPVRCAVEVDAMAGRFQLFPVSDEVDRVKALMLDEVEERLMQGLTLANEGEQTHPNVDVYQGAP